MNIYKITRRPDDDPEYDSFLGFVCIARTPFEAKRIFPSNEWESYWDEEEKCWMNALDDKIRCDAWPRDLDKLQVEQVGTAMPGAQRGTVLWSFLAG